MTEILSFPGLGLQFNINRVAFTIGGMQIYWYGIIMAAAFLAASSYALSRSKTFGLDGDRVMDVILGCVLFGIIGARAYYVLFRWDTYSNDLASIFNTRGGGLAIYGGVIFGFLAAIFFARLRRVKLLPVLDLGAGGLLLGQAIGRWGNFVNMEAFGTNTTAPWGMTSQTITWYLKQNAGELSKYGVEVDPAMPVHPTFFYESLWCLLGFVFIVWFTKRRRFDGQILLIYLGWYGLGRFFIEGLRTDSLMLGSMRISQVVALLCVLAAAVSLAVILSKIKRSNDPDYLALYALSDESKAILAGDFYKKKKAEKEDTKPENADNGEINELAEKPEDEERDEPEDIPGGEDVLPETPSESGGETPDGDNSQEQQ